MSAPWARQPPPREFRPPPAGTASPPPSPAATSTPEPQSPPQAEDSHDITKFEQEIRALLDLASKSTYYELLGVTATSPPELVKENFHRMARKSHPDRQMAHRERLGAPPDHEDRPPHPSKT